MLTFSKLGVSGRLGNQLWQIMSTVGIADGMSVNFPRWNYSAWFQFPDFFNDIPGDDVADTHDDYLQDVAYVQHVRHLAKQWIRPSVRARRVLSPLIKEHDPSSASAVHVRRGDYAEEWRGHGMLSKEWYLEHWPEGRVLVFSDDPDWCRDNLPGTVVHVQDWVDLLLISMTRKMLISNSSFAWWAAYISDAEVTAPTPWFLNADMNVYADWWKVVPRVD